MRNKYHEHRFDCGNYLDLSFNPIFKKSKGRGSKRFRPTSKTMKIYNQHRREMALERLLLSNFLLGEAIFWSPTYDDEHLPSDYNAARKLVRNFLLRLKRFRKKNDLPELKYVMTTELGEENGRIHHHFILNCADMTKEQLEKIWGMGSAKSNRVQFDKDGVRGLSNYFCKKSNAVSEESEDKTCGYSWSCSRNVKMPEDKIRITRLSNKRIEELCRLGDDGSAGWERLFPEYFFVYCKPYYNDINGCCYMKVRLIKKNIETALVNSPI